VRMCRAEPKKFHVMRFKPPHKCDLEKLHHPTLERLKTSRSEHEQPEVGEGSEYGRQWREEARRRKRGYASRRKEPDDQPWVLREKKKGGKQLSGL
jgi:transcription initiation factor TFIIF subunit alpha